MKNQNTVTSKSANIAESTKKRLVISIAAQNGSFLDQSKKAESELTKTESELASWIQGTTVTTQKKAIRILNTVFFIVGSGLIAAIIGTALFL